MLRLMKQIHLFKKGFMIFLKGATFLDIFETRLSNCRPLAIRIRFPLFGGIFLISFKPHQVVLMIKHNLKLIDFFVNVCYDPDGLF